MPCQGKGGWISLDVWDSPDRVKKEEVEGGSPFVDRIPRNARKDEKESDSFPTSSFFPGRQ